MSMRNLVHQFHDSGPVFSGLIDSLRLQLPQLAAKPLLRLLRHSHPPPRPHQLLPGSLFSLQTFLQLPLQLLIPSPQRLLVLRLYRRDSHLRIYPILNFKSLSYFGFRAVKSCNCCMHDPSIYYILRGETNKKRKAKQRK